MENKPRRAKTIGVDFDGVIHDYALGWHDGTIYGRALPGATNSLKYLMSEYAVFIFSTRDPEQILKWMQEKYGKMIPCTTEVPESGFWNEQGTILITNRKLAAVAYIDDRAIRFTNWNQAIADLDRFA